MSENTLVERIKQEAAATVADIKAAGEAAVETITRETDARVAALTDAAQADLKKKLAHMELVALAKAKQAGKIAVQEAKRTEVDAIFQAVSNELRSLPEAEYVSFFAKRAAAIIVGEVAIQSVAAPAARVAETTAILKELQLSGEVIADQRLTAGLLIVTEDGVYDVTLERLISEARTDLEMEMIQKVTV